MTVDGISIATAAPRIQCAEVWGGNQRVHVPVALPGLEGILYSRPCSGGRGGDVHYLSTCGSGVLSRVCIADVAGHGDRVAEVGRQTHDLLRRHVNWPDHRRVLRRLNESLEPKGPAVLTTMVVLTYYPPSRRLSFSYAGHPPPWHYSARRDRWRRLTLDDAEPGRGPPPALVNVPLAVDADAAFSRSRLRAEIGDRLLLVTDGVLEAHDGACEYFGTGRVDRLLAATRGRSLEVIAETLLAELAQYCGTSAFIHDDVSFLLLQVTAAPPGPALWHVIRNRLLRPLGAAGAEWPPRRSGSVAMPGGTGAGAAGET